MRALVLVVAALLAACAEMRLEELKPGQASLADVEKAMGPAADKRPGAGGETVYWYPQLPWGYVSYAVRVGGDGRLVAVEQRLTTANTATLKVGETRIEAVRDLLGPSYQPMKRATDGHIIWTYPMRVEGDPTPKWFLVQFATDGLLIEKYTINDPNYEGRGDKQIP